MFRTLGALLLTTTLSTAMAHPGGHHRHGHHRGHHQAPPPPVRVCDAGELRVSAVNNAWFDVYIDGAQRLEARNLRGQAVISNLRPGDHHVRITDFMGRVWSEQMVRVDCGAVIIGEVADRRGLSVLNGWSSPPPPRGRPVAYGGRSRQCAAGTLSVNAVNGAWFDMYVDGRLQVESRVSDQHHLLSVAPGQHHVRITDFMGRVWSEQLVQVGCGEMVAADVFEDSGLRLLASRQW